MVVRGTLLIERLLSEPWSPLYSNVTDAELAASLQVVLEALDSERLEPVPQYPQPTEIRIEHRAHRRSGLR